MAIIISTNGNKAVKVEKSSIDKEDYLQKYIYENPESIPLYEIKEDIRLLILAREFPTNSERIDAIGIDKYGELYIVETKLYANPEKRTVIAQVLDYGASLWKHSNDFNEFLGILDEHTQRVFKMRTTEKIGEFFELEKEDVDVIIDRARANLNNGVFHFVVLMDKLDDRLKDLILYVNQNSQFDIYAVELEYYKHENQEIIIPRIFGAEVKKDIKTVKGSEGIQWNWELFKQRLKEFGDEEIIAAEQIIEWAGKNDIEIFWMKNQIGSFIICFNIEGKKGFYPFAVKGDATVSWNAPHHGNKGPQPFNKPEKRAEILKHLRAIKGATVDLENVGEKNALKLPLRVLANEDSRREFFAVCLWIKKELEK